MNKRPRERERPARAKPNGITNLKTQDIPTPFYRPDLKL